MRGKTPWHEPHQRHPTGSTVTAATGRTCAGCCPYLWEFRGRALLALACLVLAKLANVGIPLTLKGIVDAFEHPQGVAGAVVAQSLTVPLALLLGYGALKFSAALFNELRDVVFARVRYRAMRRLATRVCPICIGCPCATTWSARAEG